MMKNIKIKLLPENEKRDNTLRIIAITITMIFVVVNFFIVFLPRMAKMAEVNKIKEEIFNIQFSNRQLKEHINNKIDSNIFTLDNSDNYDSEVNFIFEYVKKSNQMDIINDQLININEMIVDLTDENVRPEHSFVENVKVNLSDSTLELIVQFDTENHLANYESYIRGIPYVLNVSKGSIIRIPVEGSDDQPRRKTKFKIEYDIITAPKVGDINEEE